MTSDPDPDGLVTKHSLQPDTPAIAWRQPLHIHCRGDQNNGIAIRHVISPVNMLPLTNKSSTIQPIPMVSFERLPCMPDPILHRKLHLALSNMTRIHCWISGRRFPERLTDAWGILCLTSKSYSSTTDVANSVRNTVLVSQGIFTYKLISYAGKASPTWNICLSCMSHASPISCESFQDSVLLTSHPITLPSPNDSPLTVVSEASPSLSPG